MTSTPYQPSSPGPRGPRRTRHDPQARSTACLSSSTSSSLRASAYHSRYPSSRDTRQSGSLSAPPVGSPHAPAPPIPLPGSTAAADPSPAPHAARCQKIPHRSPRPRRGSHLPAPGRPSPPPVAATTPGSSGAAADLLRRHRSRAETSSSQGSPDLQARGNSSPQSLWLQTPPSMHPPHAYAPRGQHPHPAPASPAAAAPSHAPSDNQTQPSSVVWSQSAPTGGCEAQPPSTSRAQAPSAAHPQELTIPRATPKPLQCPLAPAPPAPAAAPPRSPAPQVAHATRSCLRSTPMLASSRYAATHDTAPAHPPRAGVAARQHPDGQGSPPRPATTAPHPEAQGQAPATAAAHLADASASAPPGRDAPSFQCRAAPTSPRQGSAQQDHDADAPPRGHQGIHWPPRSSPDPHRQVPPPTRTARKRPDPDPPSARADDRHHQPSAAAPAPVAHPSAPAQSRRPALPQGGTPPSTAAPPVCRSIQSEPHHDPTRRSSQPAPSALPPPAAPRPAQPRLASAARDATSTTGDAPRDLQPGAAPAPDPAPPPRP